MQHLIDASPLILLVLTLVFVALSRSAQTAPVSPPLASPIRADDVSLDGFAEAWALLVRPEDLPIAARHSLFGAAKELTPTGSPKPQQGHALWMRVLLKRVRRTTPSTCDAALIVAAWALAASLGIGLPGAALGYSRWGSHTATAALAAHHGGVLLVEEGTFNQQIFPVDSDPFLVGSSTENHAQITDDPTVAPTHIALLRRGALFYIQDLSSGGLTLVSGEPITERRLFGGEEILVGKSQLRFRILDGAASEGSSP